MVGPDTPPSTSGGSTWACSGAVTAISTGTASADTLITGEYDDTVTAAGGADIIRTAQALKGRAIVVVDEAYIEYSSQRSATTLLAEHPNLAVLRTLSKAHALAAARVGSLIAAAEIIAALRRCQAPYPVPQPCAELALAGAALSGFGFSLVFPALGVEAVNQVSAANRGAAVGAYSLFIDLSLGITGPLVGAVAAGGSPSIATMSMPAIDVGVLFIWR